MTQPRLRNRPILWLAVALLIAGAVAWGWRVRVKTAAAAPVAYVIPVSGPFQIGWWSGDLHAPAAVKPAQTLRLPAGSEALLVRLDGSVAQLVGPRKESLNHIQGKAAEFLSDTLQEVLRRSNEVTASVPKDAIRITSPAGVTRFTNPVITWTAKPNTLYDVAIVDPADEMAPPRTLRGAKPPLPLAALETTQRPTLPVDRIFMVLVRESIHPETVTTERCLVARDAAPGSVPEAPHDCVIEAVHALATTPSRAGDAWLALQKLPPEWRETELVVRLRLQTAMVLGLPM
jgi:hypothetical protein